MDAEQVECRSRNLIEEELYLLAAQNITEKKILELKKCVYKGMGNEQFFLSL